MNRVKKYALGLLLLAGLTLTFHLLPLRHVLKSLRITWYNSMPGLPPDPDLDPELEEVHHLVFVKVHKSASSTLYNIIVRFALSRNLDVMFPEQYNILSEYSPTMKPFVRHPFRLQYDILCNHVIFGHTQIQKFFPNDTKYVAVLRNPWDQAESAYRYYRGSLKYLSSVSSFRKLVLNSSIYEPKDPRFSFTNNRMSIDLGLSPTDLRSANSSRIQFFMHSLDKVFDLILIAEHFDESLVLLKRHLHWQTKDILYVKINTNAEGIKEAPERTAREAFERISRYDMALYKHFLQVFYKKVESEGPHFTEEVVKFREILAKAQQFCGNNSETSAAETLWIDASRWNGRFAVSKEDCQVIQKAEQRLTTYARDLQTRRWKQEQRLRSTRDQP